MRQVLCQPSLALGQSLRVRQHNFDEVFHATAAGTAQYGVVGMENSTEGVVARSLDLFLRSPVHVIGEVSLLFAQILLRRTNN